MKEHCLDRVFNVATTRRLLVFYIYGPAPIVVLHLVHGVTQLFTNPRWHSMLWPDLNSFFFSLERLMIIVSPWEHSESRSSAMDSGCVPDFAGGEYIYVRGNAVQ